MQLLVYVLNAFRAMLFDEIENPYEKPADLLAELWTAGEAPEEIESVLA